jgi:hypothetical protein
VDALSLLADLESSATSLDSGLLEAIVGLEETAGNGSGDLNLGLADLQETADQSALAEGTGTEPSSRPGRRWWASKPRSNTRFQPSATTQDGILDSLASDPQWGAGLWA